MATLTDLAGQVARRLEDQSLTLATAESCTGGLIGHVITEIPGCSVFFMGTVVAYSYEAKEKLLNVERHVIVSDGAVSYAVAEQMAQGARRLFNVDMAVAVTGIAGPGGGLPEKPVGTVHIHLSAADGYEEGRHFVWDCDRSGNKTLSAQAALTMVLDYVNQRRV